MRAAVRQQVPDELQFGRGIGEGVDSGREVDRSAVVGIDQAEVVQLSALVEIRNAGDSMAQRDGGQRVA